MLVWKNYLVQTVPFLKLEYLWNNTRFLAIRITKRIAIATSLNSLHQTFILFSSQWKNNADVEIHILLNNNKWKVVDKFTYKPANEN